MKLSLLTLAACRLRRLCAPLAFILPLLLNANTGDEALRGYHLGNSFSSDSRPKELENTYAAAGVESSHVGVRSVGGASLDMLLDKAFVSDNQDWNIGLGAHSWDYVSMLAWSFGGPTPQTEVDAFSRFIEYTRGTPGDQVAAKNADTIFYLYEPWSFENPTGGDISVFSRSAPMHELWESAEGQSAFKGYDAIHYMHSKAISDAIFEQIMLDNPLADIRRIPVGSILSELDKVILANPIMNPDDTVFMDDIFEQDTGIFRDYLHLNRQGSYVAHMTVASVVLGMDPDYIPLTFWEEDIHPEFQNVANDVIWNYLSANPTGTLTAVVPEPATYALILCPLMVLYALRRKRKARAA